MGPLTPAMSRFVCRRTIHRQPFLVLVCRQTLRHDYKLFFVQRQTIRHDYKLFFVQRQTIRHDYKLILCSGKLFVGNLLRYQIPIRVDESMRL